MFDIKNWYWVVAGDQTKLWSSARLAYVPATDRIYQNWYTDNPAGPTVIDSASALIDVMLSQWVPAAMSGGLPVICDTDASLSGTYSADEPALAQIVALSTGVAAGKPLPSGNATFKFRDAENAPHIFSAGAFVSFASAIETYVYSFQDALQELILGNTATLPTLPVHFS